MNYFIGFSVILANNIEAKKQVLTACFFGIKEFLKDTYQTVKSPQIIPDLVRM